MVQGAQFKFDYCDYCIKILLATFVRWYFNLDQVKVTSNQQQSYQPSQNPQYSASIQQQQYPMRQYSPNAPNTVPQQQYPVQQFTSQPQYSAQQYQPQYTGPSQSTLTQSPP